MLSLVEVEKSFITLGVGGGGWGGWKRVEPFSLLQLIFSNTWCLEYKLIQID